MPNRLREFSSKRNRPKVPLDKRKRTPIACTSCRLRKRRCVFQASGMCQNCKKVGSSCIIDAAEDTHSVSDNDRTQWDDVDHGQLATEFNRRYPEIGLKSYHCAHLLKLLVDFGQRLDQKRSSSNTGAPSITADRMLTHTPLCHGEIRRGHNDILAHEDFLTSATGAVSQSERPYIAERVIPFSADGKIFGDSEYVVMKQISHDFPSQAQAEVLVSAFFCYAEANWYYLDESAFRSQLSAFYGSGLNLSTASTEFICLTMMVFAMGSQFAHIYLAGTASTSPVVPLEQGEIPGVKFFQHAQALLPRVLASPSMEGLLSCLLIALYVLPIHNPNACYAYLGIALRISVCLGLHKGLAGSSLPIPLTEIRNRMFWTTYGIERWVAISLGYPEMLQGEDIDCPLPQRRPELDSPDSFRPERLIAFTKLTLLLNDITSKNSGNTGTDEIQERLISWKRELPPQIARLNGVTLRLNVHLHLHYNMLWTYTSRTALIGRVWKYLRNRAPRDDRLRTGSEDAYLSERCVEHAERIIGLIELLRNRGQLCRFSHTDFHACSSATIIILLGSILEPRIQSYSLVSTAMNALKFIASGNDLAANSLQHVDNFQALVNKALANLVGKYRPWAGKSEACFSSPVPYTEAQNGTSFTYLTEEPSAKMTEREEQRFPATAGNAFGYRTRQGEPEGDFFNDIEALLEIVHFQT